MLALLKKSYEKPRQHIKKKRHHFADKGPSSQSYGLSIVMCGCESWTVKKAEHQRIEAFELWWLRVHWTARISNQSILKEINLEYSLEGLMLKLKFQYFGHLMWSTCSLEKILMLWKIEDRKRRGWQRMRWLDGIIDSVDMSLNNYERNEGHGSLACCSPWGHKESDRTEWTTAGITEHQALWVITQGQI